MLLWFRASPPLLGVKKEKKESKLRSLIARIQTASYVAYCGNKTHKGAFDAQHPRIRRLWGLTTQVGDAWLVIRRRTKLLSPGDSEGPFTDFEENQGAETVENYHYTNPDHGQGVCASSWRAGSEQDQTWAFVPLVSCYL